MTDYVSPEGREELRRLFAVRYESDYHRYQWIVAIHAAFPQLLAALEAAEANNSCIAHAAEIEAVTERATTAEGLVRRLAKALRHLYDDSESPDSFCEAIGALEAIPPALREGE
jgi:hypothetical protein